MAEDLTSNLHKNTIDRNLQNAEEIQQWWQSVTTVGVLGEEFLYKGVHVQSVDLVPKNSQHVPEQFIRWEVSGPDGLCQQIAVPADPRVLSGQFSYSNMNPDGSVFRMILVDNSSREVLVSKDPYYMARTSGHVTVTTNTILFVGMAGTGKTATKRLILGLPPSMDRNSTPLADSAERVHIRTAREISSSKIQIHDENWQPVTASDFKSLFSDIVQSCSIDVSEELAPKLQQYPSQAERGRDYEVPENEDTIFQSAWDTNVEFKSLVSVASSDQKVFSSNWIYLIDSGGQPHFHNLLPLFVERISAAVYVLRLTDKLDDCPVIEYYKNSKVFGEPFKSAYSTADCLKYLVQSIQSLNNQCKLVCIGTHLDKIDDSSETLQEKNSSILQLLPDSILQNCYYSAIRSDEDELIIPINACVIGPDRKKISEKLRQVILSCPPRVIKVPVWWYFLEVTLNKICSKLNRKVLSLRQCKKVANALWFTHGALFEALKFFHKHHIFHYYPNVLPDVVFCDTQVLLDKVTELVEHAAFLRGGGESGEGNLLSFRDRGIITVKLLVKLQTHYVDGLFGPVELVKILEHLLIITAFEPSKDRNEYFMPSLLGTGSTTEARSKLLKSALIPLIIRFKNGWPHSGVFCCLQVYLIKVCRWSFGKLSSKTKPKQNIIKLLLPNAPCIVTLIDSITCIEVYISLKVPTSIYPQIRKSILSGIKCACEKLHYEDEKFEFAFPCPHDEDNSVSFHPALVLGDSGWMRCTLCEDQCYPLREEHNVWLAGSSVGSICSSEERESTVKKAELYHETTPSPVTIEALLKRLTISESKINCEIQQDDIPVIAGYFDNLDTYLDAFRLTEGEQQDVKLAFVLENTQIEMIKCLRIWKRHNPSAATFRSLTELLLKLGKETVASQICQCLSQDIGTLTTQVNTCLQELMYKYQLNSDQINLEIKDSELPILAGFFDSVRLYCVALELSPAEEVDVISSSVIHDNEMAMTKCLSYWKRHNPLTATYRTLLELLLKLRKENVALLLCQHLKA